MAETFAAQLMLLYLCIRSLGAVTDLKYFSTFKYGSVVYGPETNIKDYITLANDPIGNLPAAFTICSSIFIKFWTTEASFVEMYKEDETHWFLIQFATASRNYKDLSEMLYLYYENPGTGQNLREELADAIIPINPDSWYHICMGLDTASGLLRIVVNGVEVVNEEKEYFRNTTNWKPKSLKGRIILFKGFMSGFWYLHKNTFSNLNIWSSVKSVEFMVARTSEGGESCFSPGDYLR